MLPSLNFKHILTSLHFYSPSLVTTVVFLTARLTSFVYPLTAYCGCRFCSFCLSVCRLALSGVALLPLVGTCFSSECFPFINFVFLVVASFFFCLEKSLEHLL